MVESLRAVEARGRIGLVVTQLELGRDMASATVESSFLVRLGNNRWVPVAVRPATTQAGEVSPDAVAPVANDPQVQMLFRAFEGLGLGSAGAEIKQRGLNIGAATRQALGMSRAALNQDLESLALPVGR